MDIIKINLVEIGELKLNVQEYLTLLFLYVTKNKTEGYEYFISSFGIVSVNQMIRLEQAKFIKIPNHNKPEEYELREPTNELFEGDRDLFLTWINTFPVKTPSGRYLSPVGEETVAAGKLKKKWEAAFGTDTILKKHVIDVVQAEVNWRKKNNKMEFMHNAETWLNQGDWENYEYLLVTYKSSITKKNEDYI